MDFPDHHIFGLAQDAFCLRMRSKKLGPLSSDG